jgi:hypothetical protein
MRTIGQQRKWKLMLHKIAKEEQEEKVELKIAYTTD